MFALIVGVLIALAALGSLWKLFQPTDLTTTPDSQAPSPTSSHKKKGSPPSKGSNKGTQGKKRPTSSKQSVKGNKKGMLEGALDIRMEKREVEENEKYEVNLGKSAVAQEREVFDRPTKKEMERNLKSGFLTVATKRQVEGGGKSVRRAAPEPVATEKILPQGAQYRGKGATDTPKPVETLDPRMAMARAIEAIRKSKEATETKKRTEGPGVVRLFSSPVGSPPRKMAVTSPWAAPAMADNEEGGGPLEGGSGDPNPTPPIEEEGEEGDHKDVVSVEDDIEDEPVEAVPAVGEGGEDDEEEA